LDLLVFPVLGSAVITVDNGGCPDASADLTFPQSQSDTWYGVAVAVADLPGTSNPEDGSFVIGGRSMDLDTFLSEVKNQGPPAAGH
jgi:hypothetical protein